MIFISLNDFFEKISDCRKLSRQEEVECARQMKSGDDSARERLIESYLPMVAAHIKRIPSHLQSFGMVIYCQQALEKAVDSFNFEQNGETFAHRLGWYLRQATTRYIAEVR
ncbi:MAG: hypothetical protein IJZ53_05835 [Tyzzerella sp.]|nr:hypothetical protein [Tyzzerella sp.]